MFSQHALRMELNTFDWKITMTQAHDDAATIPIDASGRYLQLLGQVFLFHDQGVIARRGKRRWNAAKDFSAVVLDLAGFAMHEVVRTYDFASEGGADGLMPKAYAQQGNLAGKVADNFDADASFMGGTRARRNQNALRIQVGNFTDRDLVVAADNNLVPQFADVLHQVVGKGIVVVEDEDHVVCLL